VFEVISADTVEMSFGRDALFEERLEVFPAEPASVAHSPGSTAAITQAFIKERDDAQGQVKEQAKTIEKLGHHVYKVEADAQLPVEDKRRLDRLKIDCQNLRKENARLFENLRAAESETATLRDNIAEKAQKVKGALKKTKNAKEVASKEEEKAKNAMHDMKRQVEEARKMRKDCNAARAALEAQQKITEDLRAELKLEQSGKPHLRDTEGSRSDFTTLVVPLELRIHRADHMKTLSRLRFRRKYFLHMAQSWHETWTTRQEEQDKEEDHEGEYATESEENALDDESENKLYGGMVEGGDMMTGAEHDGWRSMKGIKAVCRDAQARYGS